MQQEKLQKNNQINRKLTPELYDVYAPPVYNKILSIVHKGPIAGKILEKVFVSAYSKNSSFPLRSPLMSLIDLADEKSNKTLKAITILNECCSGATISLAEEK